ncbi:cell division protein FtsL [Bacillus massiliglaciei]|uniref:cell division protein FtsL n=1 Tax=Bacillus massiliglaciei TaxID=1816693 RepID=UPI000DA63894|nr:cell division protein FtsL [Bacillus massiliglaciei]
MNSHARKLEEQPIIKQNETVMPAPSPKKKISFGETIILCAFATVIAFTGVKIIGNQSAIYETNKDIQQVEAKIENQEKVNGDLVVQVGELSTYERIWKKAAELGLSLNDKNVKVVQE